MNAADRLKAQKQAARQRGLESALKPFADIGQWLLVSKASDDEVMITFAEIGCLTRGNFKRAHQALCLECRKIKGERKCS
jgi:hypothetical protein